MTDISKEPSGLGGWMILPIIGLFLNPIRIAIAVLTTFVPLFTTGQWAELTTPGTPSYHPLWAPLLLFELGGNLFFIGFDIILIVLLFRKFHGFPKMFILFMVLNVAFIAGDLWIANLIPAVAAQNDPESIKELMRAVVGAAIWVPYFLVSKRVKNTFVRPEPVGDFDEDHDDPFDE